jgi:hypothetical protein
MASLISLGQLIDRSFDHGKKYYKELLTILLWIVIASTPTVIARVTSVLENNEALTAGDWAVLIFTLLGFISVTVVSVWAYISLTYMISLRANGRSVNFKQVSRDSWQIWLKYFALAIVIFALFAGMTLFSLPGLILIFTSVAKDSSMLTAIGAPLLFIGGTLSMITLLRYSIPLSLAPYILLLEETSVFEAIQDSLKLVKGRWLATFIRFVVPKFIYTLILLALNYLTFVVFNLLFAVTMNVSWGLTLVIYAVSLFVSVFTSVLITPLVIANDYYLYDSLRKTR